jgi:hypothetical protein
LTGGYRVAAEIRYPVFFGHSFTSMSYLAGQDCPFSLICFLLINFDGDIGEARLAVGKKSRRAACGQLPQGAQQWLTSQLPKINASCRNPPYPQRGRFSLSRSPLNTMARR